MTKDNWIKAFDEFLLTLDIRLLFSDRNKLEAFISQVEKDAIEKTNKRWRERCEKLRKPNESDEYGNCKECGDYDECDCAGYNEALDDITREEI